MTGCPWEIYTLSDPRTGGVRYVGVTHRGAQKRYINHLTKARCGGKTHRDNWIRSLLKAGINPILAVIEKGVGKTWTKAERQWIALYRGTCRLTNLTDGGDGVLGYNHSSATRAKLSAANRGRQVSAEARAKISAAQKGRQFSLETRAKMSAARKRRQCSPETRAKMSATRKERKRSPETRAKIGAALKGCKRSPETRAKMSASKRGKKYGPQSPELIAKRVLAYRAACKRRNQ